MKTATGGHVSLSEAPSPPPSQRARCSKVTRPEPRLAQGRAQPARAGGRLACSLSASPARAFRRARVRGPPAPRPSPILCARSVCREALPRPALSFAPPQRREMPWRHPVIPGCMQTTGLARPSAGRTLAGQPFRPQMPLDTSFKIGWGGVGGDIMSYQKALKFKSNPLNLNRKVESVKRRIENQIYAH